MRYLCKCGAHSMHGSAPSGVIDFTAKTKAPALKILSSPSLQDKQVSRSRHHAPKTACQSHLGQWLHPLGRGCGDGGGRRRRGAQDLCPHCQHLSDNQYEDTTHRVDCVNDPVGNDCIACQDPCTIDSGNAVGHRYRHLPSRAGSSRHRRPGAAACMPGSRPGRAASVAP